MSDTGERQICLDLLNEVSETNFEELALRVFRYQAVHNPIYKEFLDQLGCKPDGPASKDEIPFLPISVFKHHKIQTGNWKPEAIFRSSGTSMTMRSRHLVRSLDHYHKFAIEGFEQAFGSLKPYTILALLPHYLEAGDSSLVSMVAAFMQRSDQDRNGFFLRDFAKLHKAIQHCRAGSLPFILFGVSYALLDFCEEFPTQLGVTGMVMETGGMKGRREELTKDELHLRLKSRFQTDRIFSEYGMTELLSQAYTSEDGRFRANHSMKVIVRDLHDPLATAKEGKPGVIHIVDLLNIDSCSFIATEDLGRKWSDGSFQVLGRLDYSDLRGCQLLYI